MSAGDLFRPGTWATVGRSLGGVGERWWDDNRDRLLALAEEEVREVAAALNEGGTDAAKLVIAGRMEPAEFALYVRGTTAQLQGVARRRAELLEALEDLGKRSARMVGKAVLGALGI